MGIESAYRARQVVGQFELWGLKVLYDASIFLI